MKKKIIIALVTISITLSLTIIKVQKTKAEETTQIVTIQPKNFIKDAYTIYNSLNPDLRGTKNIKFYSYNSPSTYTFNSPIHIAKPTTGKITMFQSNYNIKLINYNGAPQAGNGNGDITSTDIVIYNYQLQIELTEEEINTIYKIKNIYNNFTTAKNNENTDLLIIAWFFDINDNVTNTLNEYVEQQKENSYIRGYNIGLTDNISSEEQFNKGYNIGETNGIEIGEKNVTTQPNNYNLYTQNELNTQKTISYNNGYANGQASQSKDKFTFKHLFTSLIDAPLEIIFGHTETFKDETGQENTTNIGGIFNFDFLGINIGNIIKALITMSLIIFIIKLFI